MSNKIVWRNKALKQLTKIDTRYQGIIKYKIGLLASFPECENLDICSMVNQQDMYRLRVNNYRILFKWITNENPKIIKIEKILKRDSHTYHPK